MGVFGPFLTLPPYTRLLCSSRPFPLLLRRRIPSEHWFLTQFFVFSLVYFWFLTHPYHPPPPHIQKYTLL
ncbi:hypothetical protein GDO81_012781 [Engystomops pustulosus]|uniref:Uncharacterized protein n=1 Tax=Engystomops pustulosus TaxID=76066 RepID=A0AAV7AZ64_ENGPU|nr:hypothetical protein GDO81_012781 [Engystomops pustulosus]